MSRSLVGAWAPWLRCRQQRVVIRSGFIVLLRSFAVANTQAGSDPPATLALTMEEAARLAAVDQPLLTGRRAKIRAEEQQAVAASQLPDPRLSGGLKELPIDTPEAFSTSRDNFTEFTIGLSQDFTRSDKRPLNSARKRLDADDDRVALANDQRIA